MLSKDKYDVFKNELLENKKGMKNVWVGNAKQFLILIWRNICAMMISMNFSIPTEIEYTKNQSETIIETISKEPSLILNDKSF